MSKNLALFLRTSAWLLLITLASSKILLTKPRGTSALGDKTAIKKEKVNNIMMRALTGVLAKNALKGVLSEKGKNKLDRKLSQNPFAILEKEHQKQLRTHKNKERYLCVIVLGFC